MIDRSTVQHYEHVSPRPSSRPLRPNPAASRTRTSSPQRPARPISRPASGPTGAEAVALLDERHGAWMFRVGGSQDPVVHDRQPASAETMITHDRGVGLNAPIGVLILQAPSGDVRLAYDLPSSLMSRLHNDDVSAAALKLDAKLRAGGARNRRNGLIPKRKQKRFELRSDADTAKVPRLRRAAFGKAQAVATP
jgi:hypothetical protein